MRVVVIVLASIAAYVLVAVMVYRHQYPKRLRNAIAKFRRDYSILAGDTTYFRRHVDDGFWKTDLAFMAALWIISLPFLAFRHAVLSGLPTAADVDPVLLQAEIAKRDATIARLEREAGIR